MRELFKTALATVVTAVILCGGIAQAWPSGAAVDTLKVGLTTETGPGVLLAQPGDTLQVRIEVLAAGPAFNAYDAYVRFDPEVLAFLPPTFLRDQEGPLMLEACPQTFHLFYQSPDSMTLEIHHSLLCAGISVTGPGVVYQLRFRCKDVDAYTHVDLVDRQDESTRFFMDGTEVEPLARSPLYVQVGAGAAPVPAPGGQGILLRASPNPFNPRTTFSFVMAHAGQATLEVYDIRGRLVRSLQGGLLEEGPQEVVWDGRDDTGHRVESGVYCGQLHGAGMYAGVKITVLQ